MQKLMIISLLSLTSLTALAMPRFGNEGGGGGTSIVCRDGQGQITKAFFYDTYAAAHDPQGSFKIQPSQDPVETQLKNVVANLVAREKASFGNSNGDTKSASLLARGLDLVERDWVGIQPGTRLATVSDVKPVILTSEKSCALETTAHYDDESWRLYVDLEIYNRLSNTDKAALKLHEAVYKYRRSFVDDTTSAPTREIVGALLSSSLEAGQEARTFNQLFNTDYFKADSTNQFGDNNPAFLNFFIAKKQIFCQSADGRTLSLAASKDVTKSMSWSLIGTGSLNWLGVEDRLFFGLSRIVDKANTHLAGDKLELAGAIGSDGYRIYFEERFASLLTDKFYVDGQAFQAFYSYENEVHAGDETVELSCRFK